MQQENHVRKYQFNLSRFLTDQDSLIQQHERRRRDRLQKQRKSRTIKKKLRAFSHHNKNKLMFLTDNSSPSENQSQLHFWQDKGQRQKEEKMGENVEGSAKDGRILAKDMEEKVKLSNYFKDRIMFHSLSQPK